MKKCDRCNHKKHKFDKEVSLCEIAGCNCGLRFAVRYQEPIELIIWVPLIFFTVTLAIGAAVGILVKLGDLWGWIK